jgi:hypothetical protein
MYNFTHHEHDSYADVIVHRVLQYTLDLEACNGDAEKVAKLTKPVDTNSDTGAAAGSFADGTGGGGGCGGGGGGYSDAELTARGAALLKGVGGKQAHRIRRNDDDGDSDAAARRAVDQPLTVTSVAAQCNTRKSNAKKCSEQCDKVYGEIDCCFFTCSL